MISAWSNCFWFVREAGPLMLSPTGQFIVPSSCPAFLLITFISEHLDEASRLLQRYQRWGHCCICSVIWCFDNLLDIGIFITGLWLIHDLKYTIVTTLASAHHVETCIYLCDISVHIMSFVKLCHWRYSVFATSYLIHLKCAALTAVHTDLCMFCIMS